MTLLENFRRAGWEEWELDERLKVRFSRGWFEEADEQRQISGTA
jgi:hypothetical protein